MQTFGQPGDLVLGRHQPAGDGASQAREWPDILSFSKMRDHPRDVYGIKVVQGDPDYQRRWNTG